MVLLVVFSWQHPCVFEVALEVLLRWRSLEVFINLLTKLLCNVPVENIGVACLKLPFDHFLFVATRDI